MTLNTGVKSLARSLVSTSGRGVPKYTGYAVYRATVDVDKMRESRETSWVLEKPNLNLWYVSPTDSPLKSGLLKVYLTLSRIGDERHAMTYCIAGGQSFNMVLSHPDKGDLSIPNSDDEILANMRKEFEDWDPQ